MHYLIDGNNLLFACRRVADAPGRQTLAARVGQWARSEKLAVTLVFDGAAPNPALLRQMQSADVELIFSAPRSADDVIEDRISAARIPADLCVISDDKAILSAARHRRCPVRTSEAFATNLFQTPRPATMPSQDSEVPADKPEAAGRGDTQQWLKEFGLDDSSC